MHTPAVAPVSPTANELMKQRSRSWLPRSIVLAVLIHVAVLSLAPEMTVAAAGMERAADVYVIPPPLDLPDPPEQIARPAAPVIGDLDVAPDITIPPTSLGEWDAAALTPKSPAREDAARENFHRFVLSMVAPELLNAAEVERELVRRYPPALRDAGIGGQVDVQLWLDETGAVVRSSIARTSGYPLLDEAALKVVEVMRLTAARNRDTPVRVIVTLPVVFRTR